MTIEYLAGNRLTGLSGDTKPTNIADGSLFYETDTNKEYVLYNNTWTQL